MSLIRSLVEVQHYWFSTFQENESVVVQLEAKQAKYTLNEQKNQSLAASLTCTKSTHQMNIKGVNWSKWPSNLALTWMMTGWVSWGLYVEKS